MKRVISLLTAVILLMGLVGCSPATTPPKEDTIEPHTYTELPTELSAEKVGLINREFSVAAGGLYYKGENGYGILSFDGKADSGDVYSLCQPKGDYFMVGKSTSADMEDVTSANVAGLVDSTGRVLVPLRYASVELLGDGFARVAELTGTTENAEEKLTQITTEDGTVMCTGIWYIYDLETGEKVPGATGTKPYISFDCGGYLKYVLDDKAVVTATSDGKVLPNDVIHLKNGHYAVPSEKTVYDIQGNKKFTYDPNGHVPTDSADVSGYIIGKKTVSDKETYVLFDLEGNVVSPEFEHQPEPYGALFLVGKSLVKPDGTPVVEGGCERAFYESVYGQSWAVNDNKTTKVVDKTGKVLFENTADGSMVDTTLMVCYVSKDSKRVYYSGKDNDYTITGAALSPFVVKTPVGESSYALVNVLTGGEILSGALDYKAAVSGSLVYVYAQNAENVTEVYVMR